MTPEPIFKSIAAAITIALGIICEIFGIHLLYKGTTATIAGVSFHERL